MSYRGKKQHFGRNYVEMPKLLAGLDSLRIESSEKKQHYTEE